MGEILSDWRDILSGVPQGSVLGPLLFVIYINDLPDCVDCESKLYADDSKLLSAYSDPLDGISLQRSIDSVNDWTKDWLMRLNVGKCKVMHLGKNNVKTDFEIEDFGTGERIMSDKTNSEKDQGVIIRADLKWGL